MDIKEIQDLIKFVAKSGVQEIELEVKGVKIRITTGKETTYVQAPVVAPQVITTPQVVNQTPVAQQTNNPTPGANNNTTGGGEDSKYITIKSPMIGTFYRRQSPDKPLLINVGDEIKPGKTLCIIEAMKLFNDIESEVSGRVVKILVDDSSPVEYDQPLFLIDPA
jgi:acetyl-CoA carboxylase biotin carboxyl carrier protein